jgi:hypothetical protein
MTSRLRWSGESNSLLHQNKASAGLRNSAKNPKIFNTMTDQRQRRRPRTQRRRGGLNPRNKTRDMLQPRAIRTVGHVVPPPAIKTISLEYRVQGFASVDASTSAPITANILSTFLPGTTSAWQALRLNKDRVMGRDKLSELNLPNSGHDNQRSQHPTGLIRGLRISNGPSSHMCPTEQPSLPGMVPNQWHRHAVHSGR